MRAALALLAALAAAVWLGEKMALISLLPMLVCALAVAAIASLLAMRRVETVCLLLFWVLPFMTVSLPSVAGVTLKLPEILAYLLVGATLGRVLLWREPLAWPPVTVQALVFLGAMALSTACEPVVPIPYVGDVSPMSRLSPAIRSTGQILWSGISWMIVVAVYNVLGRRPALFRRCVCAHILSGGLACLISVGAYAVQFIFNRQYFINGHTLVANFGYLRLCGFADEPEYFGYYLLTVIPVTLAVRLFRPNWIAPWLCTAALLMQSLAMFLTLSSGSWAGLALALLVVSALLLVPQARRWRVSRGGALRFGAGVLVLLGLAATLYLRNPNFAEFLAKIPAKILTGSDNFREDERAAGYALLQAHPVLGVGPGMDGFYFPRVHPVQQSQWLGKTREIMNLYIATLAEMGLIGFAALAWCGIVGLGVLAAPIWRYGPANVPVLTALTASLIGLAVQYFALYSLVIVHFPVLVALALSGVRLAQMHRLPDSSPLSESP